MAKVKVTAEYEGHPVIVGEYIQFPYNQKHLANNLELMKSATERHNKIYSYRMDLRLPQDKNVEDPKQFIRKFMSSYTNNLSRKKLDPDYVVKMEQVSSDSPHFHAQIFIDGNKVKDHKKLCEMAQELMEKQLELPPGKGAGLVQYASSGKKKNGYMLRRGSPHFEENFNQCYRQLSYLAKQDKNDLISSSTRKVSYSRYKRNKCRRSD